MKGRRFRTLGRQAFERYPVVIVVLKLNFQRQSASVFVTAMTVSRGVDDPFPVQVAYHLRSANIPSELFDRIDAFIEFFIVAAESVAKAVAQV